MKDEHMTAATKLHITPQTELMPLPKTLWQPLIETALREDLGSVGDLSSNLTIEASKTATARFVARKPGVVAGLDIALSAFTLYDPTLTVKTFVQDGDSIQPQTLLAEVTGSARSILTAERTALNLLGHLCGIATTTCQMVDALRGTNTKLLDTRKTLPGLRALQKYAVRCGGGLNHRFGLYDAVMLKDNHLALIDDLPKTLADLRQKLGHTIKVEVEVDTLAQLKTLLDQPIDIVLLDNMTPAQLREAVALVDGRFATEASGGVTPATVRSIAESGVDYISTGFITHSAPNLDIGLDI